MTVLNKMQQSQTPTTEDTAVDALPAATAVASNYYQRAHGSTELSDGKEGVKLYYAAAENDKLGWELGDTVVDPMYTMNRRRKEEDVTSKDSFFKRLRVKLDKNSTEEVVSAAVEHNNKVEEEEEEDSNADAADANAAPVIIGGMPFGFGMMNLSLFPSIGAALADDSSERKKSEKTSKSKKNKDKEKSDEKKKRKHKDKD